MARQKKSVSQKKLVNKKVPVILLMAGSFILLAMISIGLFSGKFFNINNNLELKGDNLSQIDSSFFRDALSPLGLSASLAAGGQKLTFFWTPNNASTKFYRLYHGINSSQYPESYDSQDFAGSLEIDISNFSSGKHYFALSAIGFNGVESAKSGELEIDLSKIGQCGNGLVERNIKDKTDEVCDGNTKLASSLSANGYRQVFNCLSDCTGWETSAQPIESCGDGIINGDETCEGSLAFPCVSGLYSGTAQCNEASCTLGTCNVGTQACNNGKLEGREQCEGSATTSCSWLGFSGIKTCASCVWGNCASPSSCGANNNQSFLNLNENDPGNCASGRLDNFIFNSSQSKWTWHCYGTTANGGMVDSCMATKRSDGACGNAINLTHASTPNSNLCSAGIASGVSYNNSVHKYTWTCSGAAGGATVNCSAPKCGDGVAMSPESCDFGSSNNGATSGCTTSCTFGNYQHNCPALPDPIANHAYNIVSNYFVPCTGINAAGTACGSFGVSLDNVTEYNTSASLNSCRYKCADGWGRCGNDVSCLTPLNTADNCGSCGAYCGPEPDHICSSKFGVCLEQCGREGVNKHEECDLGDVNGEDFGCNDDCTFGFFNEAQACGSTNNKNISWCNNNNTYIPQCTRINYNTQKCSEWEDSIWHHNEDCDSAAPYGYCYFKCQYGWYNCNGNNNDGCEHLGKCN